MAEWLEQASQWHEMYCHDLEVMSSNPGRVELGVLGTSALSHTLTKNIIKSCEILIIFEKDEKQKSGASSHWFTTT